MAYLFTHFIGEQPQGEQIYFSLSKDGLHWKDLHDGKPVICSEVGECGPVSYTQDVYKRQGVIYQPFLDEIFWAQKGKGCLLYTSRCV